MLDLALSGANLVEGASSSEGHERFRASDRTRGFPLEPEFVVATSKEIDSAVTAAVRAAGVYGLFPADKRALFLEAIAGEIEALGDSLIDRACSESGLPPARIVGERARTCGQLRMFANLIREGSWVDARLEVPELGSAKQDLRRMLVPLGPVAVFGASNFPLAFSVPGGDTASALAAGCPVVFKAHPAHPGTSELAGRAILAAAERTGMPPGVFSLLHGAEAVGIELVNHPGIEAVAFTGSKRAGRSIFDLASQRPRPVPVFAEMGSVNPLFVLQGALATRLEALAKGYADSLTMGVGQFCTNPGIVVGLRGAAFEDFLASVGTHLAQVAPGTMLSEGILRNYVARICEWEGDSRLEYVVATSGVTDRALPAVYATSAAQFLKSPDLMEEVFGPAAIAVRCESLAELEQVAEALRGQLTATVQYAESDLAAVSKLLPLLVSIAGRVVFNGFPTGVEVNSAMQHGGPYPATTDSRSTSVGTAAILRFARPVAYQNVPDELLPPELQNANPQGITRSVNGEGSKNPI